MSSDSLAFGLILRHISMVNTVLELLKIDVREDIKAASSAASMIPRTPDEETL